jgi:hypothetical protein
VEEYLACEMYPLSAGVGFEKVTNGVTPVLRLKLPLPKFRIERKDDKDDVQFVERVELEMKSVNAPTFRYHVDEDIPCSDLQIFQWTGVTVGASTAYRPTEEEQMSALLYMYSNMDEMDQYFV